jgi:hypothetical protein
MAVQWLPLRTLDEESAFVGSPRLSFQYVQDSCPTGSLRQVSDKLTHVNDSQIGGPLV